MEVLNVSMGQAVYCFKGLSWINIAKRAFQ